MASQLGAALSTAIRNAFSYWLGLGGGGSVQKQSFVPPAGQNGGGSRTIRTSLVIDGRALGEAVAFYIARGSQHMGSSADFDGIGGAGPCRLLAAVERRDFRKGGAMPDERYQSLADQRARFGAEMTVDPDVKARLFGLTQHEVGDQGEAAHQAFIEGVMNRAASRGQTLKRTMGSDYYPSSSLRYVPPRSRTAPAMAAITAAAMAVSRGTAAISQVTTVTAVLRAALLRFLPRWRRSTSSTTGRATSPSRSTFRSGSTDRANRRGQHAYEEEGSAPRAHSQVQ